MHVQYNLEKEIAAASRLCSTPINRVLTTIQTRISEKFEFSRAFGTALFSILTTNHSLLYQFQSKSRGYFLQFSKTLNFRALFSIYTALFSMLSLFYSILVRIQLKSGGYFLLYNPL